MTPEERAFYDNRRAWEDSLPKAEDLWPDIKTIEELWPELKSLEDFPVTTWEDFPPWEPIKEPPAKGKKRS
jgi:hypothetical protein